jgi:putative transposase
MNKSIAGFKIFNTPEDYQRMLRILEYFSVAGPLPKFSYFLGRSQEIGKTFESYLDQCFPKPKRLVKIIAYCLMPTHMHLILMPLQTQGIAQMMSNILNSYARYFNTRHKRQGRLWTGPFKNVPVETDEQLWHLTRYVHLNPVTAHLVDRSEDWPHSSYQEYIAPSKAKRLICQYDDVLNIKPRRYRTFVEDQINYQRQLAEIKSLLLE